MGILVDTIRNIENFLIKNIKKSPSTLPLQIDITNKCNLNCKHCYHDNHLNINPISTIEWIEVIRDYFAMIVKFNYKPLIIIGGGEPILNSDIFTILKSIYSVNSKTKVIILTNATLIDDVFLVKLKKITRYSDVEFQISLESGNEIEHDKIRGLNSFKKMEIGLTKIKQFGFKIQLSTTILTGNLESIDSVFSFANQHEIASISFNRLSKVGTANLNYTNDKKFPLEKILKHILMKSLFYKIKTNIHSPLINLIIPGLGRSSNFWEAIVIDYQGFYLASSRSRLKCGHVSKLSMENFYLNDEIKNKLRNNEIKKCGSCKHIKLCGGDRNVAFATSGDFLGEDPDCWI